MQAFAWRNLARHDLHPCAAPNLLETIVNNRTDTPGNGPHVEQVLQAICDQEMRIGFSPTSGLIRDPQLLHGMFEDITSIVRDHRQL